jgi:hypothetical protein
MKYTSETSSLPLYKCAFKLLSGMVMKFKFNLVTRHEKCGEHAKKQHFSAAARGDEHSRRRVARSPRNGRSEQNVINSTPLRREQTCTRQSC